MLSLPGGAARPRDGVRPDRASGSESEGTGLEGTEARACLTGTLASAELASGSTPAVQGTPGDSESDPRSLGYYREHLSRDDGAAVWLRKVGAHWVPRARRRARRLLARAWRQGRRDGRGQVARERGLITERWTAAGSEPPSVSRGEWHAARARSLGRPLERKTRECEAATAKVACGCGRRTVKIGCGLRWLCKLCQRKIYGRIRRRSQRALRAHVKASLAAQRFGTGKQRRPVLLTLTVRKSGDVDADRARIILGWKRLRQWCWKHVIRVSCASPVVGPKGGIKGCGCGKGCGAFHFVLLPEATDGRGLVARERGQVTARGRFAHFHAHAVVLWPFVPWGDAKAEWKRATRGGYLDIKPLKDRRPTDRRGRPRRPDPYDGVQAAAFYVAKYTSKGVAVTRMQPELAAEVLDAVHGRRLVSASHGFWIPPPKCCTKCREDWKIVERPLGIRESVLDSQWWTHGVSVVVEWGILDEDTPRPRARRPRRDVHTLDILANVLTRPTEPGEARRREILPCGLGSGVTHPSEDP